MDFNLSAKEHDLRTVAFDAAIFSNNQSFEERWKMLSSKGITALTIPSAYGGPGLNAIETAISLEGFSAACTDGGFTFSMAAHLLAGIIPIVKNGSTELRNRILTKVVSGEFILANAMTEARAGSDAFGLTTTAIASGDNYIINGSKIFCTNATIAQGIVVYALTDSEKGFFGGITSFLLEKEKHNYKCGKEIKKSGLHSSPMAEIFFEDVVVSKENIIGKIGAGAMIFIESMNWERTCMAAMHTGTMARLCNMSREYVKTRIKGNETLDKHQAVQFRIAEMFLQMEIASLLALKAAKMMDDGLDVTAISAQAKICASEALNNIARETLILHGGNGYTEEYGIGEIIADAQAALIYSGPNDVLKNIIAASL